VAPYRSRTVNDIEEMETKLQICSAVNNVFSSEEALNRWLEPYPDLKGRPHASVQQTLGGIKARR
jgi:hypothetical protein